MQYRRLGKTALNVSVIGFGASPLGNVFDDCDEQEGTRSVHAAIDAGINFFDVAPFYGITLAEERLGEALKGKRDKVILATKCGRYGLRDFNFSYQRILDSADESLARLHTDYVDLMQLHDIEFGTKEQVLNEAIPALYEIKKSGRARYIGITGLPVNYLAEIARQVDIDTILSWAHYNLLQDEINKELANPCYMDLRKHCKRGLTATDQHHCLTLNEKELSNSCRQFRVTESTKIKKMVELCEPDRLKICPKAPFQNGMVLKCLKENISKVSPGCKSLL